MYQGPGDLRQQQHVPTVVTAAVTGQTTQGAYVNATHSNSSSSSSNCLSRQHAVEGVVGPQMTCQPQLQLQFIQLSYWLPPAPASIKQRVALCCRSAANSGIVGSDRPQHHGLQFKGRLPEPRVQHSVRPPNQARQSGKQLLCDVSGVASSGRLLAVMGPSGAGKTTLLSVLAGERDLLSSGRLTGHVLLGEQQRRLTGFRRVSAHVRQEDALLSTTTAREALAFAAALKLPSPGYSKQQRAAAVQDLLVGMRLQGCADTLVGDAVGGMKGLSGGERRRLSVAVELLGQPQLAFLDEPSSGQDSSTAQQVISFIKQSIMGQSTCSNSSSRQPGILVITLHQPGREITSFIDDLLLLAPGGRVAYCGPWDSALHYFEQHLQISPPLHTGLAEWYLTLLDDHTAPGHSDTAAAAAAAAQHSISSSSAGRATTAVRDIDSALEFGQLVKQGPGCITLADAWQAFTDSDNDSTGSSSEQQQWLLMLQQHSKQYKPSIQQHLVVRVIAHDGHQEVPAGQQHSSPVSDNQHFSIEQQHIESNWPSLHSSESSQQDMQQQALPVPSMIRPSAGFWVQVRALAGRNLRFCLRNPAMVMSEAAQYLFVVLFLGSVYPRMTLHGQAAAVDRLAVLFMWVTALLVTAPSRALICWESDRRLLRRELAAGSYSLPAFMVGTKLLISLPLETCLITLAGTLLYFMLGLQATAAKYGSWIALSVLCALSASNAGNMIGLLSPDLNLALPILAVSATMLLAFAGFMVSVVPVWWSWLHEASFASYTYAGLVRNEFEGLQLQLPAADAATAAAGAMGTNSMVVAAKQALLSAVSAAQGGVANLTSVINAAGSSTVAVDGLTVVPRTIKARQASVVGFIGYMAAFAAGTTILCMVFTVLLVRVRMR